MATVTWTGLGSPGEVMWARASSEATAVVVGTAGGHLYLRRRAEARWRWERVGIPPTAEDVSDAMLLTVEASGALTLAVVGGDVQVWLYRSEANSGSWSGLGGPTPDPELPHFADAGRIVATTTGDGTTPQHALVVSSASQRPWIRPGLDPDGTWFPITSDANLFVGQLASVLVSVAPGAEPQQHIFAFVHDRDGHESGLRVVVRENSVWTWIDPGGPPPDQQFDIGLSATSIRDSTGRMQACAIVGAKSSGTTVCMLLIGSGHDWRWVDLGQPPVGEWTGEAVVADKGPDPQRGAEPVVVARNGHNIWTRSLSGTWTDRGATPGDIAVVSREAFEVDAVAPQRRLWAAGVSWSSDLWTFEADGAGVRWENHRCPGTVTAVIGAYTDAPEEGLDERPIMVFIADEYGGLWACRLWGTTSAEGFTAGSEFWIYHGRPTAAVTSTAGVGVLSVPLPNGDPGAGPQPTWVFVVGSDGHLWARTVDRVDWAWTDHGAPTGTSIETAVVPIAADTASGPIVFALANDGRLWKRFLSGDEWRWSDCGAPRGQRIFQIVGSASLPGTAGLVAVVVTEDGHLWISLPDDASFRWSDLGTPNASETIVAGIGVEVVTYATLDIAVVGRPSGQLWTLRWTPDGRLQWTPRGRPADAPIRAGIGTMRDPYGGSCLVAVVGTDEQVWVTATAGPGQAWSRWDPNLPSRTVLGGTAAVLLDSLPCCVVLDDSRRIHVVTSALG